MTFLEYILIVITMPLWIGFGRLILKKGETIPSLFAGLVVSGAVLAATCRIAPVYTRHILFLFLVLGAARLFYERKVLREIFSLKWAHLFAFVAMAIFFRWYHFKNWDYESHSILYFDPAVEMLRAEYFGNLKVSSFFPVERSSFHDLPAGIIASLLAFVPRVNILHCIEARYILIIIFFGDFFLRFLKAFSAQNNKRSAFVSALALLVGVSLFSNEFSYCLTISSFFYIFLLLRLFALVLEDKLDSEEGFFWIVMLLIAKGPLLPSAMVLVAFVWWKRKAAILRPSAWIALLLVGLNVLTWISIPPPPQEILGLSIVNPFVLENYKGAGALTDYFMTFVPMGHAAQLLYILLRIYILYFVIQKFAFRGHKKFQFLTWYMVVSILNCLFVRNQEAFMSHQRHSYYLAGIVCSFALAVFCVRYTKALAFLLILTVFYSWGTAPAKLPNYFLSHISGVPGYNYATYDKVKEDILQRPGKIENGFYIPQAGELYWMVELKSSFLGLRVRASDIKPDSGFNYIHALPNKSYSQLDKLIDVIMKKINN